MNVRAAPLFPPRTDPKGIDMRPIEREYHERLRETERGERRLLKYNVEVGKEAAALLAVVATGDARAMLDVLSEID